MALGKGLGSLIPTKSPVNSSAETKAQTALSVNQIHEIDPKIIQVNPHQPRKRFNPSELEDLINSIKIHGIIQPLVVTVRPDGVYELIAGERRLRSARVLELPTVPVVIRDMQEQQKLEVALIENIQRKNLNALEEAIAYERLMNEFNLTQEEVAQRVGKSRSTVANLLRILTLPEPIKQAIMDEKISEGHARSILSLENESLQLQMLKKIIEHGLPVREVEKEVRLSKPEKKSSFDPVVMEYEGKLREKFGTKVTLTKKGEKGSLNIPFSSNEDLRGILDKLLSL